MNPTLALDALLTHPRAAEIITEMTASIPVAFLDQANAAASDTDLLRQALQRKMGGNHQSGLGPRDVPDWLRLSVLDALAGWFTDRCSTCTHAPNPTRPQPVLAAACKPGLIVCADCTHLLSLRNDPIADATCDNCGHVCEGPDTGDGIHPSLITAGVLTYTYGVCGPCMNDLPTAMKSGLR